MIDRHFKIKIEFVQLNPFQVIKPRQGLRVLLDS